MSRSLSILLFDLLSVHPVHAQLDLIDVAGFPTLKTPDLLAVDPVTEPVSNRLRIAFYNIENFFDGRNDGERRTPDVARSQAALTAPIIERIDPDLLFVCEVENVEALGMINDALAVPFPFGAISRFERENQVEKLNIGVLSRLGPVEVAEIDFGSMIGPRRPTRGAFRLVLDLDDQHRLLAYAVHLKSNYGDRQRNFELRQNAMTLVRTNADEMTASDTNVTWIAMVLGDMNTDPGARNFRNDPSLSPFSDWADLWLLHPDGQSVTLPYREGSWRPYDPATFDRILVSGSGTSAPWIVGEVNVLQEGVETTDATILPGERGHASDHYPVWVDLVYE
ncbi:MAG TPA: hypothetical protein PKE55_12145 [Kiritimatiellia bacterium]|nr:hypothetical protein [Kiritimatiellia bacterium]